MRALFLQTAIAAQAAQRSLDAQAILSDRSYAIPRVEVSARFRFETPDNTVVIFGRRSGQQHGNEFKFALHQSVDPMAPVAFSSPLPATPMLLPPFLVPPESYDGLIQSLKVRLNAADSRRYQTELENIDAARASRKENAGFLIFSLNGAGRYLMVRLGKANDGIFLLDQETSGDFLAISYSGMDPDPLSWAVFHEWFVSLRNWQKQGLPGVEYPNAQIPERLGRIEVRSFAQDMWASYFGVRQQFANAPALSTPGPHFEICDVSAVLNYSVTPSAAADSDATSFIQTQVMIHIDDDDVPAPRLRVRLIAPEFIVVATARDALLKSLDDNLSLEASDDQSLWSVINPIYRFEYESAFADPTRRADALVLLSYRGNLPTSDFLFVWTGTIEGEEREFVFLLRHDGSLLRDPELVFQLEDPVGDPSTGIPVPQNSFSSAVVQYNMAHAGLHNFFHAAWIWHLTGEWF